MEDLSGTTFTWTGASSFYLLRPLSRPPRLPQHLTVERVRHDRLHDGANPLQARATKAVS